MPPHYDLNLMRAFAALYRERNVTRAATLINISQPAMSALLARLRALFSDPLFVRDRYGMTPTEKSDHIFPALQQALLQLGDLVQTQSGFNPASATRRFKLSVNDYFEFTVLPRVIRRIRAEAPWSPWKHARLIRR
jgi:DNA-binding transcriptional LysR family regulator